MTSKQLQVDQEIKGPQFAYCDGVIKTLTMVWVHLPAMSGLALQSSRLKLIKCPGSSPENLRVPDEFTLAF